jgi:uncharacterized protein YcbX
MHDSRNSRHVGRVVRLCRYPVKSMAAESLTGVDVSWHGVAGDVAGPSSATAWRRVDSPGSRFVNAET